MQLHPPWQLLTTPGITYPSVTNKGLGDQHLIPLPVGNAPAITLKILHFIEKLSHLHLNGN